MQTIRELPVALLVGWGRSMYFYGLILACIIFKVGFQKWSRYAWSRPGMVEPGGAMAGQDGIDLGDAIIVGILAITGLTTGVDPVDVYGFRLADLRDCPWNAVAGIWAAAFALNRIVRARVPRELLPDGTFCLLGRYSLPAVVMAGIPFVATQTLWEELLFRGVIFNGCTSLLGALSTALDPGRTTGLGNAGFVAAAFASSAMFGLAHFLPLYMATSGNTPSGESSKGRPGSGCEPGRGVPGGPGKPCPGINLARAYALVMPCVYGFIFIELNIGSGSLIPGWAVHFGLNYASLIWNRLWLGGGYGLWMKATSNSRV